MGPVGWLSCGEGEPPASDSWLSERDRLRLGSMRYTKRYEEARLSRWTAQRAVALFTGLEDDEDGIGQVSMSNAPDGSPRASTPRGLPISVSSTDRAGWAVTTIAEGDRPIGCDLEIAEPRSRLFVRDYFTPAEQRLVATSTEAPELVANLIWSAKESALKVLRTGLRRDTRTVEVSLGTQMAEGWSDLGVVCDGVRFPGWWRGFGHFLLTVVTPDATPPPVSLVEPPPLAEAEPVHTWLEKPLRL